MVCQFVGHWERTKQALTVDFMHFKVFDIEYNCPESIKTQILNGSKDFMLINWTSRLGYMPLTKYSIIKRLVTQKGNSHFD